MNLTGITSWKIDRGRSHELSKNETGTAQLMFFDMDGSYDPTNTASPLYGQLDPMSQAAIALTNPFDSSVSTLFQGYISNLSYDLDVSMKFATVTIDLVDAFDLFARMGMFGPRFGDAVGLPIGMEGYASADIYYEGAGGQYGDASDHWGPGANTYHIGRIHRILNQAGWPSGKRQIFSGNVALQGVVYDRGTTVLEALHDCADAEFPGVANLFMSKDGRVIFHGRYARFNPSNYATYGIRSWYVGDLSYSSAFPSFYAPISGLKYDKGADNIINSVLSLPQGVSESDAPGQIYEDSASITTYGLHSEGFSDLLVYKGEKIPRNDMLEEARQFAKYYVDNYKFPRNRVSQVEFKVKDPSHPSALVLWNLICGVEISDVIYLYTNHTSSGGFAEGFFVEGIHYDVVPMKKNYPEVKLTLDLSPVVYYQTDPF